ncbi:conjugal transfer protein TraN [Pasteurella multocida]
MINKKLLIFIVLLPHIVIANNMSSSFNEGKNTQQAISPLEVMKSFDPSSEFKGFDSSPKETQHYTGITGSDPNISSLGMQALNESELGETLIKSITNNPKDKISWDSDVARNAEYIKDNADHVTGENKCYEQILSKSSFTAHYCERDNNVEGICKRNAVIKWVPTGERTTKTIPTVIRSRHITYLTHIEKEGNIYKAHFKFNAPVAGVVMRFRINYRWGSNYRAYPNLYVELFNKKTNINIVRYEKEDKYPHHNVSEQNIILYNGQEITATLILDSTGLDNIIDGLMGTRSYHNYLDVELDMLQEIDNVKPITEWRYSCPFEKNAIKKGEVCSKPKETRTYNIAGQSFNVTNDCWEYTEKWIINEASDNECKQYENKPNCTVGELECISSLGDLCKRHRVKYQCETSIKTKGKVCGEKFFCSDGTCSELENNQNAEFGHAVSQLATLAQAGKDVGLDPQGLRAFSGRAMFCRKTGFGFSNCCKDSGWGHQIGLAHCNSEETALGRAKERNLVIYTGTYCDKKVLGKCIRKKSSYCVFDSKLARIVQYQGRSGQLGIGFGSAESPNCRGLQVQELQKIDFKIMDYSDFFEELNNGKNIPSKSDMLNYINKSIHGYYQE